MHFVKYSCWCGVVFVVGSYDVVDGDGDVDDNYDSDGYKIQQR